MQYPATELRRISLPRTPVNKNKKVGSRAVTYPSLLAPQLVIGHNYKASTFLHCLQRTRPIPYLQDLLQDPRQSVDLPSQGDMKDDE